MGDLVELYGAAGCPYTSELREHLLWTGVSFTEYDVDADAAARARLVELTGAMATVPVLVERGRVTQVGWHGHGCVIG